MTVFRLPQDFFSCEIALTARKVRFRRGAAWDHALSVGAIRNLDLQHLCEAGSSPTDCIKDGEIIIMIILRIGDMNGEKESPA